MVSRVVYTSRVIIFLLLFSVEDSGSMNLRHHRAHKSSRRHHLKPSLNFFKETFPASNFMGFYHPLHDYNYQNNTLHKHNSLQFRPLQKENETGRSRSFLSYGNYRNYSEDKSSSTLTRKEVSSSRTTINSIRGNELSKQTRMKESKLGLVTGNNRETLMYQGGHSENAVNNSISNIRSQIGGDTFLPCRVGHLGDRQVSWIRSRDWHVLTSGNDLYTSDWRFSVLHQPGTQDWTLHIKFVTPRDNGTYECQVSTGTGIISLFVNLTVVTPVAYIPGQGEYHVNKDSPVVLTCIISESPTPPRYVFWYHNGQLLNFLRNRRDFSISLEEKANAEDNINSEFMDKSEIHPNSAVYSLSKLQIRHAEDRHSGNYTCSAPKAVPASTLVFVTKGDKTAAVQRIHSDSYTSRFPSPFLTTLPILLSLNFLTSTAKLCSSLDMHSR